MIMTMIVTVVPEVVVVAFALAHTQSASLRKLIYPHDQDIFYTIPSTSFGHRGVDPSLRTMHIGHAIHLLYHNHQGGGIVFVVSSLVE